MQGQLVVVVAHPDDESLGAGGTIYKLTQAGMVPHVICLSNGVGARDDGDVDGRLAEFRAAMEILGVKHYEIGPFPDNQFDDIPRLRISQWIQHRFAKIQPNLVITHSSADLNIDHRLTHEVVLHGCRPSDRMIWQVWGCEIPSSTEWGMRPFAPNVYSVLIGEAAKKREEAIKCYKSELRKFPHPRSITGVTAREVCRGTEGGLGLAVAFELIREVI